LADGDAKYRTLINTYYSMTGSVISSFLLSILFSEKKKIDMVSLLRIKRLEWGFY
jgi:ammonium transporter Rh